MDAFSVISLIISLISGIYVAFTVCLKSRSTLKSYNPTKLEWVVMIILLISATFFIIWTIVTHEYINA